MRVFFDAWPWIAIVSRRDRWHEAAQAEAARLVAEAQDLVTTNLAMYEAYTRVLHDAGRDSVLSLRRRVQESRRASPPLRVMYVGEELEMEAWDIFVGYRDKRFSFPDCVAFAVMRREGIDTAFTGDEHFRQMGFLAVPAEAHTQRGGDDE